jgi:hypothetical protein
MPENVTGFQPTGNLKKSLRDLAYFDMLPSRSPTFFREEPIKLFARTMPTQSIYRSVPWSFLSNLSGQLFYPTCRDGCQWAHRFSSNLYAGNVVSRLSSTGPPTVKW